MNSDGGWAAKDVVTAVLSSVAIVVSALSIGWQYLRSRFDQPRIHVLGKAQARYNVRGTSYEFGLEVSNYGERAVTIVDVYWVVGESATGMRIVPASGPPFPLRLDAYDLRSWTFGPVPIGMLDGFGEAQPWVELVGRPSFRQRRRGLGGHRLLAGHTRVLEFRRRNGSAETS